VTRHQASLLRKIHVHALAALARNRELQLGALLMLIPLNVWIPVAMSGMLIEDKTHTRT